MKRRLRLAHVTVALRDIWTASSTQDFIDALRNGPQTSYAQRKPTQYFVSCGFLRSGRYVANDVAETFDGAFLYVSVNAIAPTCPHCSNRLVSKSMKVDQNRVNHCFCTHTHTHTHEVRCFDATLL